MTASVQGDFAGTARYRIVRRIGGGSFGDVFEAYDRLRGQSVALKALPTLPERAKRSLRAEFRGLAEIAHPNLVRLHELVLETPRWFFTMELVSGVELLAAPVAPTGWPPLLLQLARGIDALHRAGRLHRDLTASHVAVTESGRVVIFGLGLVADAEPGLGGLAYLSPERCRGDAASAASDWYAFGVILFEALTGRSPFAGAPAQVSADKQKHEAPLVRRWAPEAPPHLADLCRRLLLRDAGARPTGAEILRWLEPAEPPVAARSERAPAPRPAPSFVGREAELRVLREGLAAVRRGRAATVRLYGPAGVGKSALVRAFAEQAERAGAVVVVGVPRRSEPAPFGALEPVVEALCARAIERSEAGSTELVQALVTAFPTLGRRLAGRGGDALDTVPPELARRRVVAAVRRLFAAEARVGPLVVVLDDLHRSDPDSGALLRAVLAPPDHPALLLVGVHRAPDDRLDAWPTLPADEMRAPWGKTVALGGLEAADARALATEAVRIYGDELVPTQRIWTEGAPPPQPGPGAVERLATAAAGHPATLLALASGADPSVDASDGSVGGAGAAPRADGNEGPLEAAERAMARTAFHWAADAYGAALRHPRDDAEPWALHAFRGEALALAGRPREAATAYLDGAEVTSGRTAFEMRRRSAEFDFGAGPEGRALRTLQAMLRDFGLPWLDDRVALRKATAKLMAEVARATRSPAARDAPSEEGTMRMDLCWSLACGLAVDDPGRAAHFAALMLHLAQGRREPLGLARALFLVVALKDALRLEDERPPLDALQRMAQYDRRVQPWAELSQATAARARGDWTGAAQAAERARALLETDRFGAYENLLALRVRSDAAAHQGQARVLATLVGEWRDEAAATNHRSFVSGFRRGWGPTLYRLMTDQPREVRRLARTASNEAEDLTNTVSAVMCDLYEDGGATAHQRLDAVWPGLDGSALPEDPVTAAELLFTRAKCLLVAPGGGPDRDAAVRRIIRRLARVPLAYAGGATQMLRGMLALHRGRRDDARAAFEGAHRAFSEGGMPVAAAVALLRQGELTPHHEGRWLKTRAEGVLASHGVARPWALARVYAPVAPRAPGNAG